MVMDDSIGTYFKPEGSDGIEFGLHYQWDVGPSWQPASVGDAYLADGVSHLARRVPSLADAALIRAWGAVDGFTPDGAPLIGPVSTVPGLFVATGASGTGYKIAPAVGRDVAYMVATGTVPPDIAAFGIDRFARGQSLATSDDYRRAPWRSEPPSTRLV